jgi:hypothetical protein
MLARLGPLPERGADRVGKLVSEVELVATLVQLIGSYESTIGASREDTGDLEVAVRDLRRLAGIAPDALVQYDYGISQFRLTESKKAVARARRKGVK